MLVTIRYYWNAFSKKKVHEICEEDDVLTPVSESWPHKFLNVSYPEAEKNAVRIRTEQIKILEEKFGFPTFFNDVLIDFYMRYVQL